MVLQERIRELEVRLKYEEDKSKEDRKIDQHITISNCILL